MPYIKPGERARFDHLIAPLAAELDRTCQAGELNYIITRLILLGSRPKNYAGIATVTGVLENVKQELYRRLASPYEDAKIAENGDCY